MMGAGGVIFIEEWYRTFRQDYWLVELPSIKVSPVLSVALDSTKVELH